MLKKFALMIPGIRRLYEQRNALLQERDALIQERYTLRQGSLVLKGDDLISVGSQLAKQQLLKFPQGHGTDESSGNLGFGFLYYGLARIYQPEVVVCIGSFRGFVPICFALGLVDNNKGMCYFIDPGKVDDYWHDPENVQHLQQFYGVENRFQHLLKTSQQVISEGLLRSPIDILFIDGDHSYEFVKYDFDNFGKLVRKEGLILLHDSIAVGRGYTEWEVKQFLEAEVYGKIQYQAFTIAIDQGLTLVRKRE